MSMYPPIDQRPYYDKALKALKTAREACFKHPDRDLLGMSHGPFSGVNEALGIVSQLETVLFWQNKELLKLRKQISELEHLLQEKEKKMNDNRITNNQEVAVPFNLDGEGEAAPQEATIFIVEDGSDHPVTPGA